MPTPHRHLSVDELSHRASTGLAIRRGDVKISEPIPSSYIHNGAEMDGITERPSLNGGIGGLGSWSGKTTPVASHGRSGSAPLASHTAHISRFTERTSSGPSISPSNMIPVPPSEPISHKKDSGLRASLKRMFSKKAHSTTIQKRGAHNSDPGRLVTTGSPPDRTQYQSSVHYTTATPGHPLNSHATSPHLRVQMINNGSQASDLAQLGKRRNTLPILTLDSSEQPEEPRRRQSGHLQEDPIPQRPGTSMPPQMPPSIQYLNRRSKSAGALTDLVLPPKTKVSDRRDRSEEIAFWRNSVVNDPLPQMPSIESMSSLNSFKAQARPRKDSSKQPRPSIEPVQDFDFGLNGGTNNLGSGTLQDRVNTLEIKLFDFEYALAKLQGTDLEKPTLPKKTSPRRSVRSPIPESRASSSSTNDTSCLSSPDEKWSSPMPRQQPQHRQDRTSKATTIKPVHTRRPSSRSQVSSPSIHITRSQYDALQALIEDEKAARHQLEMRMVTLQQQVESLKYPAHAYARAVQYPTPSPDSSQNPAMLTASGPLKRSPAMTPEKNPDETSRFSMSETDPETETDTDDRTYTYKSSPEVFETPQETTFRFEPRIISPSGMF